MSHKIYYVTPSNLLKHHLEFIQSFPIIIAILEEILEQMVIRIIPIQNLTTENQILFFLAGTENQI